MKKIGKILCALLLFMFMTGCGSSKDVSGSLEDIMTKLYDGIPESNLPMGLSNTEITSDDIEYYVGTKDIKFDEAIVSESMVGSIAHSVVLLRVSDDESVSDVVKKIEDSANPRKWICVEAEEVYVLNKGNLVVLIMSDTDRANAIKDNFNKLK